MKALALFLNILWFILGGWALALQWFFGGLILAITIIGIPFVPGVLRIGLFAAFPFGQEMVDGGSQGAGRAFTGVLNIIWLIFAGIWIAISHVLAGLVLFLTIIGIPFGFAHFKLAGAALMPVGKDIQYKDARSTRDLMRPVRD